MSQQLPSLSLLKTLAAMDVHAQQDRAVADYLKTHGEIDKDFAYMSGIEGCGRIKNLGQRIRNLRLAGWVIETVADRGRCSYKLISAA